MENSLNGESSCLNAALQYLNKGWSVIPLYTKNADGTCSCGKLDCESQGKHPRLLTWAEYQRQRPPLEQIRSWFKQWPNAGIAIIGGSVSGGLAVFDVDDVELAKKLLSDSALAGCFIVKTPRGGLHVYLRETLAKSRSGPLVAGKADLKAEKGYVVAAPSAGYKVISKGELLAVPDAKAWSLDVLKKYSVQIEPKTQNAPAKVEQPQKDGLLVIGVRKSTLLSLACSLLKKGCEKSEVVAAIKGTNQALGKPPLTDKEVTEVLKSAANYQQNPSSMSTNVKSCADAEYTALFPGLVDLVEHEGNVTFLVKEGDKLSILPQVQINGILNLPPPKEQIPWLLPQASEVLRHYEQDKDAKLYDDLLTYHKNISELPHEDYYDLLVAWDFHTYLQEAFQYSPMIWLFAIPERGKTRTGKGMIYVAYRGMHVESLREAYLLRMAKSLHATMFFDVMDIWGRAKHEGSQDVLLLRYEKGAMVPRVMHPDRPAFKDTVYYPVFGSTVIGTNIPMNPILETRCLMLSMPSSGKTFEGEVKPETSLPFKERLVAFRARRMSVVLPEINKPVKGRLGDITRPLVQTILLVRPEREAKFLQMIARLEQGRREEKVDTIEGELLAVIQKLDAKVSEGKLAVGQIAEDFNSERGEKHKLSNRSIGWKLRALGFEKTRTSDGKAGIYWNEAKLKVLLEEHGMKITSETQETHDEEQKKT